MDAACPKVCGNTFHYRDPHSEKCKDLDVFGIPLRCFCMHGHVGQGFGLGHGFGIVSLGFRADSDWCRFRFTKDVFDSQMFRMHRNSDSERECSDEEPLPKTTSEEGLSESSKKKAEDCVLHDHSVYQEAELPLERPGELPEDPIEQSTPTPTKKARLGSEARLDPPKEEMMVWDNIRPIGNWDGPGPNGSHFTEAWNAQRRVMERKYKPSKNATRTFVCYSSMPFAEEGAKPSDKAKVKWGDGSVTEVAHVTCMEVKMWKENEKKSRTVTPKFFGKGADTSSVEEHGDGEKEEHLEKGNPDGKDDGKKTGKPRGRPSKPNAKAKAKPRGRPSKQWKKKHLKEVDDDDSDNGGNPSKKKVDDDSDEEEPEERGPMEETQDAEEPERKMAKKPHEDARKICPITQKREDAKKKGAATVNGKKQPKKTAKECKEAKEDEEPSAAEDIGERKKQKTEDSGTLKKWNIEEVEAWLGHPLTELKRDGELCSSNDKNKRVIFKADRNPVGILQFVEKSDDNKKPTRQGVNFIGS